MKEISLRPYPWKLYFVRSSEGFEQAHKELFGSAHPLADHIGGQFAFNEGPNETGTYLVYAEAGHFLAHEMAHVVLDVFDRIGSSPSSGNGEPFCYLLQQLIYDATGVDA